MTTNIAATGYRSAHPSRHQSGVALAISLIFLLIMTILGISTLSTSTLEEKMAGSLQEQSRAFQSAEAGALWALTEFNGDQSSEHGPENNATGIYEVIRQGDNPRSIAESDISIHYIGETVAGSASTQDNTTDGAESSAGENSKVRYFEVRSSSETSSTRARAQVNLGITMDIPATAKADNAASTGSNGKYMLTEDGIPRHASVMKWDF